MASKGFNTKQYGMLDLSEGGDFATSAAPPIPEPANAYGPHMDGGFGPEPYFEPDMEDTPPELEQPDLSVFEYDTQFRPATGGDRPKPRRSIKRKNRRLASAPGTKMMSYLYARSQLPELRAKTPSIVQSQTPIYTQSPEALKAALNLLGVRSERNPLGIDVSLDDAKIALFGDKAKDLGDIDKTEFKYSMETGDSQLDRKNVRQFVNSDGSTTYEVINPDKSIMAKFTVGEYKGKKVFVPGGYTDYAAELRKMFASAGSATAINDEFEKLRRMLFSGGI